MSSIRTSKRSRKPSDALCDTVRSEKMQRRRADKETAALSGSYVIDYDSNSGPEVPQKRNKKEYFQVFKKPIDVRSERGTSLCLHR